MDSTLVTACAALVGSLMGAAASLATTWITQRTQASREYTQWQLKERESLYSEFITEASRLAVDALTHSPDRPDKLVPLYGILGRIRLLSSAGVLHEAESICRQILELYSSPNMTPEQIYAAFAARRFDPLNGFSAACREELLELATSESRHAPWRRTSDPQERNPS